MIVGIAAAADQRRVADAARGVLFSVPPVDVAGGEISMRVQRHRSDGIVRNSSIYARYRRLRPFVVFESGKRRIGESGRLALLRTLQALALAIEHQFRIVDERHAVRMGKLFRAGADEVDVRALLQHQPRRLDGIAQALHAGHAAGLHAAAVHQKCVELHAAVGGEEAAAARVEGGIVFQHRHGSLDGVERRAAPGEDPYPASSALRTPDSCAAAASSGMAQAPP